MLIRLYHIWVEKIWKSAYTTFWWSCKPLMATIPIPWNRLNVRIILKQKSNSSGVIWDVQSLRDQIEAKFKFGWPKRQFTPNAIGKAAIWEFEHLWKTKWCIENPEAKIFELKLHNQRDKQETVQTKKRDIQESK